MRVLPLLFTLVLVACPSSGPAPQTSDVPVATTPAQVVTTPAPPSAPPPEIRPAAPTGPTVVEQVRAAVSQATRDGRQLVVYVGATWCEPCRRFHNAVLAGELNEALAGVRFLEFDHDVHQKGLEAGGYLRRFVPLFAIPQADGHASARVHQGAIRGPGAVDFILPRLKALLTPSGSPAESVAP